MEYSNPVLLGFSEAGQDARNAHNGLMEALIQSSRNTNNMLLAAQQNFYQNQMLNLGLNPRTFDPLNTDWRHKNINEVSNVYKGNQERVGGYLPSTMPQGAQVSTKANVQGGGTSGNPFRNSFGKYLNEDPQGK